MTNPTILQTKIFTHSEPDIDLAVTPLLPPEDILDFGYLGDEMIATQTIVKENEIGGDDVFFSGLFTSHVGKERIQPIIRFGKVALISDEKVTWIEDGKPSRLLDIYLLECQSYGGNSGSPVFFHLNPMRSSGTIRISPQPQILLAGVMMGSFLSANQVAEVDSEHDYLAKHWNCGSDTGIQVERNLILR